MARVSRLCPLPLRSQPLLSSWALRPRCTGAMHRHGQLGTSDVSIVVRWQLDGVCGRAVRAGRRVDVVHVESELAWHCFDADLLGRCGQ